MEFVELGKYGTKQAIVNLVYPVGSYYTSSVSTSPEELFGGTWEQIKDRMILAVGDTHSGSGATGGEATHTLSVDEMPSHDHTTSGAGAHTPAGTISTVGDHAHSAWTDTQTASGYVDTSAEWYSDAPGWQAGVLSKSAIAAGIRRTTGSETNNSIQRINFGYSHGHAIGVGGAGAHSHAFSGSAVGDHAHTVSAAGGGNAHNNMPPYITAYVWKRTA